MGTLYGQGASTTLGVNWYLNPYVYLQVNYNYAEVPNGGPDTGGVAHTFNARWNMHF